jgi:addiction module RelE/StbE family toxin
VSYKITRTDKYLKKLVKLLRKNPSLQDRYFKTIKLLTDNPHHPSLRLHKLQGELKDYYSASISMKYRIVLDLIITDKEIILIDIGSHSEVY